MDRVKTYNINTEHIPQTYCKYTDRQTSYTLQTRCHIVDILHYYKQAYTDIYQTYRDTDTGRQMLHNWHTFTIVQTYTRHTDLQTYRHTTYVYINIQTNVINYLCPTVPPWHCATEKQLVFLVSLHTAETEDWMLAWLVFIRFKLGLPPKHLTR